MTLEPKTTTVCPTCGSKVSEGATRCSVCGRNLGSTSGKSKTGKGVQSSKMPAVTLNLPIAIALVVLLIGIGAAVVFGILRGTASQTAPTGTPTITPSPTQTLIPTATLTSTPDATFTPLPTLEYIVKSNDSCVNLAVFFGVKIKDIVMMNNLPPDCGVLSIGQRLYIPQPTPTASPQPTNTLVGEQATDQACPKAEYVVKSGDTLGGIASSYNVSAEVIRNYNGLPGDTVYEGRTIVIPLCQRNPTPGPTPTATLPPPYQAANLLLPPDGSSYTGSSDTITLQWAAVGSLRENESYQVVIQDVTSGEGLKTTLYTTSTNMTVPANLRPNDSIPHVFRWTVQPVRQSGTTKDGEPVWQSAGAISESRVFSWFSTGPAAATPTP